MPSITHAQLRSGASTSQQAAGNEEETRRAAMQAAMMDDLGIARVAELPLDDGHGGRDRHNRGPGANLNHPAPLPMPSASSLSRQSGNAGAASSSAGDLWRQAYTAGIFDDEDAAAVRGLDDLGGGRIYERVVSQTMEILNQHTRSNPMIPAAPVAGPSSGAVVPSSNTPLPFVDTFVVLNVVYQRSIRFSSRDIREPAPAIVLLSAVGPPANGGFTVVICNHKYCQWPISAWYDYTSGPDLLLGVFFKEDNGTMHGYELHFDEQNDLLDFMAFVQRLREGRISPPVGQAYTSHRSTALHSQPASGAPHPGPAMVPTQLAPIAPLQHTQTAPLQSAPAAPPPAPAINARSPQTAVAGSSDAAVDTQPRRGSEQPQDSLPSHRTARGPTGESNQPEARASSSANTSNTAPVVAAASTRSTVASILGDSLAENKTEDVNFVSHQYTTSSPGHGTVDATSIAGMSPEGVSVAVRGLFQYFLSNPNLAAIWTAEKKKEMASAIKTGVLDHIAQEARSQGLDDQQVHGIGQLLDDTLAPLIQDGQGESDHQGEPDHQSGTSRIRYPIEELISMRPGAVSPPAFLADIPHLPKPNERRQLQRVLDAMIWVQGEAPLMDIEETPKVEPEAAAAPAPTVTRPADTQVTGLRGSRWASDEAQIRHANHFTGPAYENVRSGHGHMNDLAQLEPQAQVTGSSVDLIGLDFHVSDTDTARAGLENSQVAVDHISQASALTNSTYTTTDKIENLGLSMSRLTIRSPTKARAQLVTTSAAQSSDRGSVSSPGPAAPTTLHPTAPVFTPNTLLRPSVNPAPVLRSCRQRRRHVRPCQPIPWPLLKLRQGRGAFLRQDMPLEVDLPGSSRRATY
ncbi:uncharacterized protein B0T15DRAFT_549872 [Chaetomium strumarium]|uniref:Uncharacterized protein n=1 Tax=Chaetomium strumarium TaxID=1170767 RepID=A0AAJ0GXK2_9PEZI|nr:hypothetical protein B0T15DRAFT_549872 [Chaetomium strumarium]